MIIEKIAEPPRDDTPSELMRFLVQSLSAGEIETINFLVGLWDFYNRNDYLTERQHEVLNRIFKKFKDDFHVQFPEQPKKKATSKTSKKTNNQWGTIQ